MLTTLAVANYRSLRELIVASQAVPLLRLPGRGLVRRGARGCVAAEGRLTRVVTKFRFWTRCAAWPWFDGARRFVWRADPGRFLAWPRMFERSAAGHGRRMTARQS